MAERRRLPVLSNTPPQPAEEPRPPWHWVGFGAVAIIAAWLPLAYVGAGVSARVMASRFGAGASQEAIELALGAMSAAERARLMALVALPSVLGLAVAAFGGGFVVGRFGERTTAREAALSGVVVALVACAMAWAGPTWGALLGALVMLAVASGFAAWGGRLGASGRAGPGAKAG